MESRATSQIQAMEIVILFVYLAVIKTSTSEIRKRDRRGINPNQQTLTKLSRESLSSAVSILHPYTTIPSTRTALLFFIFPQAIETGVGKTSSTAHIFLSSSTSLLGTAAISTGKKAYSFSIRWPFTTFICAEQHIYTSCSIPRKSSL